MKEKGFSMMELMLVILIVALFATFTYPSYQESITRARRIDGQTALIELAGRMEAYYALQQSYEGATLGTGSESDVLSSKLSAQNWYSLVITEQTDKAFKLAAIPREAQALADKACQTLNLTSFGAKTISPGPGGTPKASAKHCWS